jgi:hypothetical protein
VGNLVRAVARRQGFQRNIRPVSAHLVTFPEAACTAPESIFLCMMFLSPCSVNDNNRKRPGFLQARFPEFSTTIVTILDKPPEPELRSRRMPRYPAAGDISKNTVRALCAFL